MGSRCTAQCSGGAGFLVLTIAGEHLELARVLVFKQSPRHPLVAGDLFLSLISRQWGGLLNEVAGLLFLGMVVFSARRTKK